MVTRYETYKRRALQKLWNKLDEHVSTHLTAGIVLAISGGPDSRALLEAVASWPKRHRGQFVVATIDHAIRKDSAQEARFIEMRARRLGFDAFTTRLAPLSASEHKLRSLRYQALVSLAHARGYKTIVTGHQSNDNAEGYVMALLGVGGGELGAAMNEIESIDDITLCRPFLSLTKGDLLLALTLGNHTDFVRDQCDEARQGKRALVRYDIVPTLQHYSPNILSRLKRFACAQAKQGEFIEKAAWSLIVWREQHAILSLDPKPDPALLISALWQIIKCFSDGKDLRSVGSLITAIAEDVLVDDFIKSPGFSGLDPRLNGFNLNALNVKHYQVPGAVVLRAQSEIQVRRI
jgi:tRNA(Ile)-lysidine synthetase-like protein